MRLNNLCSIDMQPGVAENAAGFVEPTTAKPKPELSDLPEESWCKVIPFERVG